MPNHPRAGTPARPEDLVDVDALLAAVARVLGAPDG